MVHQVSHCGGDYQANTRSHDRIIEIVISRGVFDKSWAGHWDGATLLQRVYGPVWVHKATISTKSQPYLGKITPYRRFFRSPRSHPVASTGGRGEGVDFFGRSNRSNFWVGPEFLKSRLKNKFSIFFSIFFFSKIYRPAEFSQVPEVAHWPGNSPQVTEVRVPNFLGRKNRSNFRSGPEFLK